MKSLGSLLVALIVALVLLGMSAFTVDQREYAVVFRLGEIVSVDSVKKSPGLYFKIPFVEDVRYFDKRILTLDSGAPEKFFTKEKTEVQVDSFVKWRIVDPAKFYVSIQGGNETQAEVRLAPIINEGLRAEFGVRTLHDVVSGERDQIMRILREKADKAAREMGIEVLDVRLKRVDFTDEISGQVYSRMDSERKRMANDLRAQGAGASEKIRADANKQREVILAEAYRDAQRIKGEGDGRAAEIYAAAYNKNPEFYAFYRSLDAYRNSFKSKNDILVMQPDSDFFKYMRDPGGKKP
ncbi:MAG: protease modulator HflC [Methylobacillus sp.]|jgi:membrane protease subunit HflC|nr:protease modulator HflC [Methylobacillus sp.]